MTACFTEKPGHAGVPWTQVAIGLHYNLIYLTKVDRTLTCNVTYERSTNKQHSTPVSTSEDRRRNRQTRTVHGP